METGIKKKPPSKGRGERYHEEAQMKVKLQNSVGSIFTKVKNVFLISEYTLCR